MPFQKDRYPSNWKEISLQIRFRSGERCEWCGAENGKPNPITGSKVVLTVAHLGVPYPDGTPGNKHDKLDVREENLAALCQRCHLNFDRDEHRRNAAKTRYLRKVQKGQLELIADSSQDEKAGRELEGRTWDEMPNNISFAKA
jgi:hypothetical protein